jgi:cytidyltransferase-like protein
MSKKKFDISVASGGFDPIHSGHIQYLKDSKSLANYLIVALNSDSWLQEKKGKHFMPFYERKIILESLKYVDEVISFDDDEIGSCINALESIKKNNHNKNIVFCNGGDRNENNIPEEEVKNIEFAFNVGGSKKQNSSSFILKEFQYDYEKRVWGKFYNLFRDKNIKVKELIISPGKGISYQRHFYRNELWFVSKGQCLIRHSKVDPNSFKEIKLKREETFFVKKLEWHQIINPHAKPCHIIEIQYGESTKEQDIERLSFYENN